MTRVLPALVASLLAAGASLADASLAPPPLDFSVSPSAVTEGGPATVRIERLRGAGRGEQFDVYLAFFIAWDDVVFMTPAGVWSAQPVPYRQNLVLADFVPVVAGWPHPAPVGSLIMGMFVVRAGTPPLVRANWLYQPVIKMVRVKAASADALRDPEAVLVLGSLAVLTLAALIVVLLAPRRAIRS